MSRLDYETRSAVGRCGKPPRKRKNAAVESASPVCWWRPAAWRRCWWPPTGSPPRAEIRRGVQVGAVDVGERTPEEDDEVVLYDGVLHRDSDEPLVDEKGNTIPPSDVPVAPVDP